MTNVFVFFFKFSSQFLHSPQKQPFHLFIELLMNLPFLYKFRAGRVDAKMRDDKAPKEFDFLSEITEIISRVYRFVNMGKEFHHFLDVCAELKESGFLKDGRLPRFFSNTR